MSLISKAFVYPTLYSVDKTLKHPILASVFTPPLVIGGSYALYMQVGAAPLLMASAATAAVLFVPAAVTGIVCYFSPKARAAVKSCFFSVFGRMLSIFITNALDNPRLLNIINHFVKDPGQQALIAAVINNSKDNLKGVVRELCKGENLEALYDLRRSKSKFNDAVKFLAKPDVSSKVSGLVTGVMGSEAVRGPLLAVLKASMVKEVRKDKDGNVVPETQEVKAARMQSETEMYNLVAAVLNTNNVEINALISELLKPENINAVGQFYKVRADAQKAYDDAVAKGGQEPQGIKLGVIDLAYAKLQDANKNYASLMNLVWERHDDYGIAQLFGEVNDSNTQLTNTLLGVVSGVLDANTVIDQVLVIAESKMVHLDMQKVEDKITKLKRDETPEEATARVGKEVALYAFVTQLLKTPAALDAVKDLIKNVLSSPQIAQDLFAMYSAYKEYSAAPKEQKLILAVMPLLQKDPGVYHSVLKPFIAAMIKVLGNDQMLVAIKAFIPAEYQAVAEDVLKSEDVGNKLVELVDAVVAQPVEEIVGLYDKYDVLAQAKVELKAAQNSAEGVEAAKTKVKTVQNELLSEGIKFVSQPQLSDAVSGLVGGVLDNFNTDEKKANFNTLLDAVLVAHAPKEGELEHRYYKYELALSSMLKEILGSDAVKEDIKDLIPLLLKHDAAPSLAGFAAAFQAYSGVEEGNDDTKELIVVLKETAKLLQQPGVDKALGETIVHVLAVIQHNPKLLKDFIKTNIIDTEPQILEFNRIIEVLGNDNPPIIEPDKKLHPGGLRALLVKYNENNNDDNKNALRTYLERRISKHHGNKLLCELVDNSVNGEVVGNVSKIVEGLSGDIGKAIGLYADYAQHGVDQETKRMQDLKRVYNDLGGDDLPQKIRYKKDKNKKLYSDEFCNLIYAYNTPGAAQAALKAQILAYIAKEFKEANLDMGKVENVEAVQQLDEWSQDFKDESAKFIQEVVLAKEEIYGSAIGIVNAVLPHAKEVAADKMKKSAPAIGRMVLADDNATYEQIVPTIQQILENLKNLAVEDDSAPLYIFNRMYNNWTQDSSIGSSAKDAICSNQGIFDAILNPAREYVAKTGVESKGDLLWLVPLKYRSLPIKGGLPLLYNGPIMGSVAGGWGAIGALIVGAVATGAGHVVLAAAGTVKTALTQAPVESGKQLTTNVFGALWSMTKAVTTTAFSGVQAGYHGIAGKPKSQEQQLFEAINCDGAQQSLSTRIFDALDDKIDNNSLWQVLYDGNFSKFEGAMTIKNSVIDIKVDAPSISALNLEGCVVQSNIKVKELKSLKLKDVSIPLDVLLEICGRSQEITLEGVTITKPLNPLKVLTSLSLSEDELKTLEVQCGDRYSSSIEVFSKLPAASRIAIEQIFERIQKAQQGLSYPGFPHILSRSKSEKFEMMKTGYVPKGQKLTDEDWQYFNEQLEKYKGEIDRSALESFIAVEGDLTSSLLSSASFHMEDYDDQRSVISSSELKREIDKLLRSKEDAGRGSAPE